QTLPALSEVTADSIDKFKEADKVVIVGFVAESDKESYKTLNTVAESLRDNFLFGVVTDAELAKKYDVTVPGVLLFKKFDDGISTFDGALTAESLQSFVKSNAVPLLAEIDGDNFSSYVETGLPLAYIFADNDEDRERLIKALQPVAKEYRGKVNFVHIDAAKYGGHASNLNLKEQWPAFGIQQPADGAKFPYDQTKEITFEGVREFVTEYVAGKISPSIKSQAVPEKNDEPVKVIVSTQFDEIVYDKEKDVFIEFYAPWCGHCKKLAPVWEELAALISSNPANSNVVIAKMDGTENDLPVHVPFRLEGFPTLKLFKAGAEKEVINYNGDRSLEDLVEFLKTNAKNTLDIPAPAPKVVKQDAEDHENYDDRDEL
ncbi:thioredoxin-like domain-containing protein, partial [Jimgerdemannia flammicorona]